MTLASAIALLLAVTVVLASARQVRNWFWPDPRRDAAMRPRAWRAIFLLAAQAAGAVLLYFLLFPPAVPIAPGTLVVLTADAGKAEVASTVDGETDDAAPRVVALPEAGTLPLRWSGAERVPDLATALRRHPAHTLQVVGAGLTARDRPAVGNRGLRFDPAPLPRGLLDLQPPPVVAPGRGFALRGRTQGLQGGSAELLDPAGRRVSQAAPDASGRFVLHGSARDAGLARFRLRLRDGGGRVAESIDVPVQVVPARPLRALVLAGAPNPELKFLRRWADAAGIDMAARIELGAGLQLGDGPTRLDAATLDRIDLLLVDERSWGGLGAAQRAAVLGAVERGLGLLLRMSAAAGSADRRALQALGFEAAVAPRRETRLGAGFVRAGDAVDALPPVTRSPVRIGGTDSVVALEDAGGDALALWHARGRGRIGVAIFDDSFRLALAGRGEAHGEAWSRVVSAVARSTQASPPLTIAVAPPGERSVVCRLAAGAQVRAPDGRSTPLLPDPRSGRASCAGYWAHEVGWHEVRQATPAQGGGGDATGFQVPAEDALPAMRAHALREATLALAGPTPATRLAQAAYEPGPRWPWFLGWLVIAALAWWLERSRHGLRLVEGSATRNAPR